MTHRLKKTLSNQRGVFDLQSLMIGIIVLGVISGIAAATIFAVIPWAQDRAAKETAQHISVAQDGYSSKNRLASIRQQTSSLPKYGDLTDDSSELVKDGFFAANPTKWCSIATSDGSGYETWVRSDSGRLVWDSNRNSDLGNEPYLLYRQGEGATFQFGGSYNGLTPVTTPCDSLLHDGESYDGNGSNGGTNGTGSNNGNSTPGGNTGGNNNGGSNNNGNTGGNTGGTTPPNNCGFGWYPDCDKGATTPPDFWAVYDQTLRNYFLQKVGKATDNTAYLTWVDAGNVGTEIILSTEDWTKITTFHGVENTPVNALKNSTGGAIQLSNLRDLTGTDWMKSGGSNWASSDIVGIVIDSPYLTEGEGFGSFTDGIYVKNAYNLTSLKGMKDAGLLVVENNIKLTSLSLEGNHDTVQVTSNLNLQSIDFTGSIRYFGVQDNVRLQKLTGTGQVTQGMSSHVVKGYGSNDTKTWDNNGSFPTFDSGPAGVSAFNSTSRPITAG